MVKNLTTKFRSILFYRYVIPNFQVTGHLSLCKFFQAVEKEGLLSSSSQESNINPGKDKDITQKEIISLFHSRIQM